MNINFYLISITAGLAMIYIFFNPMKLPANNHQEIPQLEITDFTVYDLSKNGLASIFQAQKGFRYKDRYEATDINYTDTSKKYIANISSKFGIYKDSILTMNQDVIYKRADGLTFTSDAGSYNETTGVLTTPDKYVSYKNNDRITGTKLHYNSKDGAFASKGIFATYEIKN